MVNSITAEQLQIKTNCSSKVLVIHVPPSGYLNVRHSVLCEMGVLDFTQSLSTALFLCFRGCWPWEKAQSCTAGTEDGSEQSGHREPCHCCGSKGLTEAFAVKAVMFFFVVGLF